MTALESLLRRERVVVVAGLVTLTALAWFHIWRGAGMGMTALQMTELALFPHSQPEPMPGMEMPAISWLTVIAMWWVMMIAMMVPSAAPFVLLYMRAVRHPNTRERQGAYASTALLIVGYLFAWLMFSAFAAGLQAALQRAGLIYEMMLWSRSAALSATLLALAGIYQLTPLKRLCLARCRGPASFLARHWRPDAFGAFRMGLEHGAWCVSCCWVVMLLLFVGGVMNVVWIALLAILILMEKLAPFGTWVSRVSGVALLVWSFATVVVAMR